MLQIGQWQSDQVEFNASLMRQVPVYIRTTYLPDSSWVLFREQFHFCYRAPAEQHVAAETFYAATWLIAPSAECNHCGEVSHASDGAAFSINPKGKSEIVTRFYVACVRGSIHFVSQHECKWKVLEGSVD